MIRKQFPGCLDTPWGRAELIPGSTLTGTPQYEVAGEVMPIDTDIPRDLAGRWFWLPPYGLSNGGVCIAAVCYPPPLCYEQARAIEREMTALEAPRQLAMELV